MLRNILLRTGCFLLALGLGVQVCASENSSSISGHVRSAAGVPQMGAVVEVMSPALHSLKVFTDDKGFYSASGLLPGFYSIKVSAPSFLTTERERIGLHAGATMVLNVTLNTLFDSVRLAPTRDIAADDDWKWVLRSSANRPILRVVKANANSGVTQNSQNNDTHDFKGTLSFLAGSPSEGFGSTSDMSTGFSVERSIFSDGTIKLGGNVGYGDLVPATVLRVSYNKTLANGSQPQVSITFKNLASPDLALHGASLQALTLSTSDSVSIENLDLHFGSQLQTVQFMGRVSALKPFGTADYHLGPNTVVEYAYATSEPDTRREMGFDSAPADLTESGPRMSIADFSPALEHAHHQEISLSRRAGKTNMQVAVFSDRIADPALTGVGQLPGATGQILGDLYSGTFTYRGSDLNTRGARVVLQRKLSSDITATMDYSYGGVLDLDRQNVSLADARRFTSVRNRHSVAGKVSGTVPGSKAQWIASYRWISGEGLTPVDMFNASGGRADPYLNVFFRQPIPSIGFLPGHMEGLIEVRNLLAQGYIPVLGNDGRTVYLVQSARSVRGGVAFSF